MQIKPAEEVMPEHSPYRPTPQLQIHSGFGPQTTAREVLQGHNLDGAIAVVTGGHSGLGFATTRALAEAGAHVFIGVRTPEKARSVFANSPRVAIDELDLIDPASVDSFAERFLRAGRPLHVLINNAGIMAPPLMRDRRGYESQFATNHLGHFQLTARLWPALAKARSARVISLSSTGVRFGGVDFDDPNFVQHPYDKWKAYGQSKTANSLFAVALDRRGYHQGIRAFSVHPGRISTDLGRFLTAKELAIGGEYKTAEQGAATSVWCSTSQQLSGVGGVYCMDCDIAPVQADFVLQGTGQVLQGVLPWAIDREFAERLWQLSERLTGVQFEMGACSE